MKTTRIIGSCIVGLALGVVPAAAGTASAAELLTQAGCTADLGTFSVVKNVKTCTIVFPAGQSEDGNTTYGAFSNQPAGQYQARYTLIETSQTTLVLTQKGKKPIGTAFTTTVLSRTVTPVECTLAPDPAPLDLSVCAALGLYPANV